MLQKIDILLLEAVVVVFAGEPIEIYFLSLGKFDLMVSLYGSYADLGGWN